MYYNVGEIFKSIQGEGPYMGHPAIFIRMANCNLKCDFCDTDFTHKHTLSLNEIIDEVMFLSVRYRGLVVITGGEPLLQDLDELIAALYREDFKVQIETNGTIYPEHSSSIGLADIVVSPKDQPVDEMFFTKAVAVKFVVKQGIFPRTEDCNWQCPIYVQPMDEKDPVKNKKNQEWAVKLCLEYGYRLSLQLHKLLEIQ